MDEPFSVEAHDGKRIYGLFDQAAAARSDRVLILSHGITGRIREFIHVMSRRAFNAAGYDVVRFSYYDAPGDARKLRECTLDIQSRDLNSVVEAFRTRYKKIFVAGHSYGGLTAVLANPRVTAISLWDSSWKPAWPEEVTPIPELDCFAFGSGQENIVGRAMLDEALAYVKQPPFEAARDLQAPTQVVLADSSDDLAPSRREIFDALGCRKELQVVAGADHQFTVGDSAERLIAVAKSWFDAC